MLGTIVNTIAILCGSTIGSVLRKGVKEQYQAALFNAMGFSALAIGVNAVVANMPKSQYPVLFILSMALGSFLGSVWDWDANSSAFPLATVIRSWARAFPLPYCCSASAHCPSSAL